MYDAGQVPSAGKTFPNCLKIVFAGQTVANMNEPSLSPPLAVWERQLSRMRQVKTAYKQTNELTHDYN